MMSYTQDELDSTWKELKDGTACDAHFQLDRVRAQAVAEHLANHMAGTWWG
jgi:hypothetical protein